MQLKKVFLLLCGAMLIAALPAVAQTPTVVTGTITDSNGTPYSFAKVSATLLPTTASPTVIANGIPTQIGGQANATADANGVFSMNLFCNTAGGGCSAISPSGTTWQISAAENGFPPPLGTGPQTCTASITITGASQSVTASFAACPALSQVGSNGLFQTRGIANSSQAGLNLINDTTVGGVTVTNTTGNSDSFALTNLYAPTGSTQVLAGLFSGALQSDILQLDSSLRIVNKTPGVALRTDATATPATSCAAGGDRGQAILLTNASNPVDTTPQAGVTCLSNFYTSFWGTGAGGFTLKATTSTINGIPGATGIQYLANTWVDLLSNSNTDYVALAARAVKCTGSNLTDTPNADGTVTCAMPGTLPMTVASATSGGIPYFSSTTQESSSAVQTANVYIKGGGAGAAPTPGLTTDDGTTSTYTGTGGTKSPAFTSTGSTAGFTDYPQGTTSTAVAPCNTATSICEQAPAAVTSYSITKPGAAPTIASYKQTDTCGSSNCTETFHPTPLVLRVTADFTDASSTALQNITGLGFTFPANQALNAKMDCDILYDQTVAAVADAWGVQDVTVAPTNIEATGFTQTAATTWAEQQLPTLAATTATNVGTFTPSAITTIWHAQLHFLIEQPSNASTSALNVMVSQSTAADLMVIKRGSACTVTFQ